MRCWSTCAFKRRPRAQKPARGTSGLHRGGMGEVGLHAERGIWPGRSAGMVLTLAASLLACAARAEPPSAAESRAFIDKLWPAAQVRGISRTVFERATADFLPDP